MAVAPLQIPQSAQAFSGGVDFSPLANLGNVYKQAQADAVKQQTLASLGQGGQADAAALLKSGDISLAQLGVALRNRQEDQARQAAQDARQAGRDTVSDQHWAASYKLQEKAVNRADEDKFGIKEVTDPTTGATTFVKFNPRTGEVSPTGPQPTGAATSPANPFAYSGAKPQTESQSKDSGYANRMFRAEGILRDPAITDAAMSLKQRGFNSIPVAGNYLTSPEFQKYDQAKRDFVNAVLRRESGAAISDSEFANAEKQYFPQPGDTKERIAEKQRNRQDTLAGIAGGGGPNYKPPFVFDQGGGLQPTGAGRQGETKSSGQGNGADSMLSHAREAIAAGAPRDAVIQRLKGAGIDPSGL